MIKRSLNLVRRGKITYPLAEEDYQMLMVLGTPVIKIEHNMYPILHEYLIKKKIRVVFYSFLELELQVFDKIRDRIGENFTGQPGDKVINWVQANDERGRSLTRKLGAKLTAWYKRHHIAVEVDHRNSRTKIRTTLRKIKPT